MRNLERHMYISREVNHNINLEHFINFSLYIINNKMNFDNDDSSADDSKADDSADDSADDYDEDYDEDNNEDGDDDNNEDS